MTLMKKTPIVINLGLDAFNDALKQQGVECRSLRFIPPIASKELLDKIRRLRAQ